MKLSRDYAGTAKAFRMIEIANVARVTKECTWQMARGDMLMAQFLSCGIEEAAPMML